ncbi:hypothetical protein BD324DRAFT_648123 [Kockovaella imperatae]|uniref:Uncharacterized protein n=1 Tax=Kockovaella imperatae TaxID=4999 RepID=A0A1Y1UT92_9TREE|nr:hypothetical protein BD324DRAFT_648123 [Kockovaella imperatae]ORX41243.1 hypothetical protein BD324DRAFT_648123 [Kockovaella imperatae]
MQSVILPTASAIPSILPGPFILLLLLPVIPLLLFSVGARPPDTSHLPFSTDDLWQTTAFITIAGAVVLCVGLYPGAFRDVAQWITGAEDGADWRRWWTEVTKQNEGAFVHSKRARGVQTLPHPRARARPDLSVRQIGTMPMPRFKMPAGNAFPQVQLSASEAHLKALRMSPFPGFSVARPPLLPWVAALCALATLLIIALGKILGSAYDSEAKSISASSSSSLSSSSSSRGEAWPARELRKRKSEKDDETKIRLEKEVAAWRTSLKKMDDEEKEKAEEKRQKEVEAVRKELEKRKLSTKYLELYLRGNSRGTERSSKGTPTKPAEDSSKLKVSEKVKGFLFGPPGTAMRTKKEDNVAVTKTPAQGPGWRAADDAVAHAAIRGGAARAESLGNQLVAQKREA